MSCLRCVIQDVPQGLFPAVVKHCREIANVQLQKTSADENELQEQLQNSDVVVGVPLFLARCFPSLSSSTKCKWVHSTYAGVDALLSFPKPSFPLTRHGGRDFGQYMAEYIVAQMVNRERKMFDAYDLQKEKSWRDANWPVVPRFVSDLTIGVLGVGNIGKRVAEVCKSLGMTVWGLTRSPVPNEMKMAYVDQYRQLDGLSELLAHSDYVCNILPSTALTRGLLDGSVLQHCSAKKSVFINIGRGDIITENTLVHAIRQGWLSGAILDVFEREPLPPESELWRTPGVTITPHISGPTSSEEAAAVFAANLKLFLQEENMHFVVDWERGY